MIPANTIRATLPGGLWIEGQRHQQALLRPISGRDEACLSDEERRWLEEELGTKPEGG